MTELPEKFELTREQGLAVRQLCKALRSVPGPLEVLLGKLHEHDPGKLDAEAALQLTSACLMGVQAAGKLEDVNVWAAMLEHAN